MVAVGGTNPMLQLLTAFRLFISMPKQEYNNGHSRLDSGLTRPALLPKAYAVDTQLMQMTGQSIRD